MKTLQMTRVLARCDMAAMLSPAVCSLRPPKFRAAMLMSSPKAGKRLVALMEPGWRTRAASVLLAGRLGSSLHVAAMAVTWAPQPDLVC